MAERVLPALARPWRDPLLRHSLLLMAAAQVGNVLNLLFQFVMMRSLPPAEYGLLAALLSLMMMVGVPSDALRTAVAHVTARLRRDGEAARIRAVAGRWLGVVAGCGFVLFVLLAAASGPLAEFLRLPGRGPLVAMAAVIAFGLALPAVSGVFQGLERFGWLGWSGPVQASARLAAGIGLVAAAGGTAAAAVGAQALSVAVALGFSTLGLWRVLPPAGPSPRAELPNVAYFARSLAALSVFGVLMNGDIWFVKHYFDAEAAGTYARAATLARAVVFLPGPIAAALFPKVVSMGERSVGHTRTLGRALLYAALLIGGGAAVAAAAAPWIWRAFVGAWPSPAEAHLVRVAVAALSPLGLVTVLLNFEMAQHRFAGPLGLAAPAAFYAAAVALRHDRMSDVLAALGGAGVLAIAILAFFLRPRATPRPAVRR